MLHLLYLLDILQQVYKYNSRVMNNGRLEVEMINKKYKMNATNFLSHQIIFSPGEIMLSYLT